MLLDDTQVALNDLLAACQESIEHCSISLERTDAAAVRSALGDILAARREDVERLTALVRESGALPRAANADREELHGLVEGVKTALSGDETRLLVDERLTDERRIEELANEALRQGPTANAREGIEAVAKRAGEARERLRAIVADA